MTSYTIKDFRLGPAKTPLVVKLIVVTSLIVSVIVAVTGTFAPVLAYDYFYDNLGLTIFGLKHLYLWQFITYSMVQPAPEGLSLGFFINMVIELYLIWVTGSALSERFGKWHFLILYYLGAIIGGLGATAINALSSASAPFVGTKPPLYALLFAWILLNPKATLHFLFAMPIRIAYILLFYWGFNLIIDFYHNSSESATAFFLSGITGAAYSLLFFKANFPFGHLKHRRYKLRPHDHGEVKKQNTKEDDAFHPSKVYDFKTGSPILNNEEFMDAMLAKISLHGEDSLTKEERDRMREISDKKKNK